MSSLRSSQNEALGGDGPGGGPGGDGEGLHDESLHEVHAHELANDPDTHWLLKHGFPGFPTVQHALSTQHQLDALCAMQLSQVSITACSIISESKVVEVGGAFCCAATASMKALSSVLLAVVAWQPPPPPLGSTHIGWSPSQHLPALAGTAAVSQKTGALFGQQPAWLHTPPLSHVLPSSQVVVCATVVTA